MYYIAKLIINKDAKRGSINSEYTEVSDIYSEMEKDKKKIIAKIKEDLNETSISNKKLVFKMAGNGVSFLKDPMTIEMPETIGGSPELGEIAYVLVD